MQAELADLRAGGDSEKTECETVPPTPEDPDKEAAVGIPAKVLD